MAAYNVDSVRDAWNAQQDQQRQAVRAQRMASMSDDEVPPMPPYSYVKELWTDHLIVNTESGRRGDALSSVAYTVDDNGNVNFGASVPVKVEYVPLSNDSSTLLWTNPHGRAVSKVLGLKAMP